MQSQSQGYVYVCYTQHGLQKFYGVEILLGLPCRWGFGGKRDVVWVLGSEGQVGAWTQPAQLSSLMQSLDKRGVREAGLMQSLNAANMRSA